MIIRRHIFLGIAAPILFYSVCTGQPETDEQLAAQYYNNGEFDKAVVFYEKLFQYDHEDPVFYNYYLNCLLKLNEYSKAEKAVSKQLKQNPRGLNYMVDMGYIQQCAGNQKKAEEKYQTALKQLRAEEKQVHLLAGAFMSRGLSDYAIEAYSKGRKLFSGLYNFRMEVAAIYEKQGKHASMVSEYISLANEQHAMLAKAQDMLQTAISENQSAGIEEIIRTELLRRQQQHPDNQVFSEMHLWLCIQQKDFSSAYRQAKALDNRLREDGYRLANLAKIAASNGDYDAAIQCYRYLIDKGSDHSYYETSRMGLLEVMYAKITSSAKPAMADLLTLEQNYLVTIEDLPNNTNTPLLVKGLAHLRAFYLDKTKEAISALTGIIQQPGGLNENKALCKLELAGIYLMTGEVWESTLLYSQVEKTFKNGPIGHEAKFRNAKLSYYIGEFEWAQAQLDVLKASTSKLIANDAMQLSLLISDNLALDTSTIPLAIYSRADFLQYRKKDSMAFITLDTLMKNFPGHTLVDEALFMQYKILMKTGDMNGAAGKLEEITNNYAYDILGDDALFALAEVNEKFLNNRDKAKELYQKLLNDYSGSVYTVEARKRFRKLRGDNL